MRPIRPVTGVISGLPAKGYFGRERPPQGVLRKCKLRHTPAPAPGRKKGGVAPVHLHFPRAATRWPEMGP